MLKFRRYVTNVILRDIYYRDPELFVKQLVVDRYVDDIAYTLGVKRQALNVVRQLRILINTILIVLILSNREPLLRALSRAPY
jgi:DNA topoisomerase VI subunit A